MEEDDVEVDILGDFNLESLLLDKSDTRLVWCNSGGYNSTSWQWVLESNAVWSDELEDDNNNTSMSPGRQSSRHEDSSPPMYDSNGWTDKERYLLQRGLELFGESWSRVSEYIGSKTAFEVRNYVNQGGGSLPLPSSPNSDDINIIDDPHIPTSLQEVITVVSTGSPTFPGVISNQKKSHENKYLVRPKYVNKKPNYLLSRTNQSRRRPKGPNNFGAVKEKPKLKQRVNYNAVCRVNRNEEIVKIRYEEASENCEVDIEDIDGETTAGVVLATARQQHGVGDGDGAGPNRRDEDEPLTGRPSQERELDPDRLDDHELAFQSQLFKHPSSSYFKIRNHIVNCWKASRPQYVTKSRVRRGLKNCCKDMKIIASVHDYLEQIGAINFGCQETRYNNGSDDEGDGTDSDDKEDDDSEGDIELPSCRTRSRTSSRFKTPVLTERDGGGLTMVHDSTGAVTHVYNSNAPNKKRKLHHSNNNRQDW